MIPRREAKRLLDAFLERWESAENELGEELDGEALERLASDFVADSDLVLRGAENAEQKARRYLTEGRLVVRTVNPATGLVVATCAGEEGDYDLGRDPKNGEWRCTCPAPRKCSHLIALRLVVRPS